MLALMKSFLWDPAAARAVLLTLLTIGGAYVAQPVGRSWQERLMTAAAVGVGVGGASLPSYKGPPPDAKP